MATYSFITAATTIETTETACAAISVPGGARLKKVGGYSVTGTGVLFAIRIEFPGIRTPQVYMLPVAEALQGTEVGSGTVLGPISVDIDIPIASAKDVTLYGLASAASQSCRLFLQWEA